MTSVRAVQRLFQHLTFQVSSKQSAYQHHHQPSPITNQRSIRKMATSTSDIVKQDFNYFLVLDFEATCVREGKIKPQEIIEFPVLKINSKSFETESTFHSYVQPTVHGVSEFCTELTGITQSMVDGQPTLEETLKKFDIWFNEEGLNDPGCKSVFVTCGDWDLKTMLPQQCQHFKLDNQSYFNQWINIKKAFAAVTGHFPKGMMPMLHHLDIDHEGRHHSGIDDCKNIAKILAGLARRGYKFSVTGSNTPDNQSHVKVNRGSRHGRRNQDSKT